MRHRFNDGSSESLAQTAVNEDIRSFQVKCYLLLWQSRKYQTSAIQQVGELLPKLALAEIQPRGRAFDFLIRGADEWRISGNPSPARAKGGN